MPSRDPYVDRTTASNQGFVQRMHCMRMLGTALCALPIASVLDEHAAPVWLWIALGLNVLAWPHIAWLLAMRARDGVAAEYRNLVLDAAFGGLWIAAIALSVLPTAILISVLGADRFAAGGMRLLRHALMALSAAFAVGWLLVGFAFVPVSSTRTVLACLPVMVVYQITLSVVTYRLGRRIARQNRELERVTRTDLASDLANRRHFDVRAAHAFERSRREGHRAAVLLIDIDCFKDTNDRYGHAMGDIVLRRVGGVLSGVASGDDVPARFGGDEFALLLTPASRERAVEIAEHVRAGIAGLAFDAEPDLSCTVSIGLADSDGVYPTLADWIRAADAALYRAKAAGRNRVEAA